MYGGNFSAVPNHRRCCVYKGPIHCYRDSFLYWNSLHIQLWFPNTYKMFTLQPVNTHQPIGSTHCSLLVDECLLILCDGVCVARKSSASWKHGICNPAKHCWRRCCQPTVGNMFNKHCSMNILHIKCISVLLQFTLYLKHAEFSFMRTPQNIHDRKQMFSGNVF